MSGTLPAAILVMAFFAGLLAMGLSSMVMYRFGFWRTRRLRLLAAFLGAVAFMAFYLLFIWVSSGVTR